MKKLILILILCGVGHGADVLFIGNSRGNSMNHATVTSRLGYSTYLNGAINSATTKVILTKVDSLLALADPQCIVFIDMCNDPINIDFNVSVKSMDTIITKCLAYVTPDKFILVQSTPNTIGFSDETLVSLSYPASKEKTKYITTYEYDLTVSKGLKFAPILNYLSSKNIDSADIVENSLTTDGIHYTARAYDTIYNAITNAKVRTQKTMHFGGTIGYDGCWKSWTRKGSAAISGDTTTGAISITNAVDTIESPVVCIGWGTKRVTITPTLSTGTATIQYRSNDRNFKRNATSSTWLSYSDTCNVDNNFIQFRLIPSGAMTIDSIVFTWSNVTLNRSIKKSFGVRDSMIGMGHKDNYLLIGSNAAGGGYADYFAATGDGSQFKAAVRWRLENDIPQGSHIDSAKWNLYTWNYAVKCTLSIAPAKNKFGYLQEWDESNTANSGTATWYYNSYYNSAANVKWVGDSITRADCDTITDTMYWEASGSYNVKYTYNVTRSIQRAVNDYSKYNGFIVDGLKTGNGNMVWWSQQAANESLRPYLEVWYTAPVDTANVIRTVIDSIYFDGVKMPTFTQTGTTLQFAPLSPVMWNREAYPFVLYCQDGAFRYDIKFKKSGGALGSQLAIRVSTGL